MITPTQVSHLVQNGLSLQQFKCLIQSPKCKHPPSSLAAKVASESSKVCRNLLSTCPSVNCPRSFWGRKWYSLPSHLSFRKSTVCSQLLLCSQWKVVAVILELCAPEALYYWLAAAHYSCVQAQKEALPKAQQVHSSRLSTQTHVSRELGFSTLASSIQERLSGLGVLFVFSKFFLTSVLFT